MAICKYFEGESSWTNKPNICKLQNVKISNDEARKCKSTNNEKCPRKG
jgi:hypothetical protein